MLSVDRTDEMYVPTIDRWRIYDPTTNAYEWMLSTQHQNTPTRPASTTSSSGWNAEDANIWKFDRQIFAQMAASIDSSKRGSNENGDGSIRREWKKSTDFKHFKGRNIRNRTSN